MDIPRRPYLKFNEFGGTSLWFTGVPDPPCDVPDIEERSRRQPRRSAGLRGGCRRGTMTPSVLDIDHDLRLVRLDAPPAEALSWVPGPRDALDGRREARALHAGATRADVRLALGARRALVHRGARRRRGLRLARGRRRHALPGDLPIVIGEKDLRSRHAGRRVIEALCERARSLGWREVLVGEIYDWNVASQRCFSAAGF